MAEEIETFGDQYQTKDECPQTGTWICKGHPVIEKHLKKGEIFPKCHQGAGHNTIWHLIIYR